MISEPVSQVTKLPASMHYGKTVSSTFLKHYEGRNVLAFADEVFPKLDVSKSACMVGRRVRRNG